MKLNNYAEKHGVMIRIIFVLIDLKREIKENIVFVMKAKTYIKNAFQKQNLFEYINVVFN